MSIQETSPDVVYHGHWHDDGNSVIMIEDPDGNATGVVPHLPKHSPTGMNWGYAGSGPADTARSLLIAALGEDAICQVCTGTTRIVYVRDEAGETLPEPFDPDRHQWAARGWICQCDGGYRQLPYPRFTSQYVVHWSEEWTMSRASILEWLSSNEYPD